MWKHVNLAITLVHCTLLTLCMRLTHYFSSRGWGNSVPKAIKALSTNLEIIFKKEFLFLISPINLQANQWLLLEEGGGWNAEVSSWFLVQQILEGRSGGRCWNIHSLMQKHKWMKFCSCFQAVLRIEKKKCLENKMFILSLWLWPSQFFFHHNRWNLIPN